MLLRTSLMNAALLLSSVCILGQQKPSPDFPVLTVCEALRNADTYNTKKIIVVGRFSSTDEGAWLSEDCGHKIERKHGPTWSGGLWRPTISLTYVLNRVAPPPMLPRGFKWDLKALLTKLSEVQRSTKLEVLPQYHYSDKWFAVFGRFEASIPLEESDGFGHLNGSPAQLISRDGFKELKPK